MDSDLHKRHSSSPVVSSSDTAPAAGAQVREVCVPVADDSRRQRRPIDSASSREGRSATDQTTAGCAARRSPTSVAMWTEPLREVRDRFSEVVDRVEHEHDRFIVTRNGRPAAVILSADDLAQLEETPGNPQRPRSTRRPCACDPARTLRARPDPALRPRDSAQPAACHRSGRRRVPDRRIGRQPSACRQAPSRRACLGEHRAHGEQDGRRQQAGSEQRR
jgi:prevent-host-death family protein